MEHNGVDTAWDSLFSNRPLTPDFVDLTIGAPGPELLCNLPPIFLRATKHRMENDQGNLFQYGPETGISAFKQELANFLSRRYGDRPVIREELLTTCGATSGIQLAATVLLDRKGVVFVEDPTYFISLSILCKDLGLKVVPVPMTEEGIDVSELEKAVLKEREGIVSQSDRYWAMVYTIPNFHNPTGVTMSPVRGKKLIELATKQDMLVVCDDVYNLLSYSPVPFSRLRALQQDHDHCVISNGTFSKILAPGVRLGWMEASPHIVAKLANSGFLQSGGSMNNLTSGIATSLISLGLLDKQLDHCKEVYGARMAAALKELTLLPAGWSVESPGGGYFLWIKAERDLAAFCRKIEENGVAVLPGPRASSSQSPQSCNNAIRISIAYFTEEKIALACKTIVKLACDFVM